MPSKKILFNIITCNRFYYFKNCIESIIECFDMDKIDLLISDNFTIENGFDDYVSSLMVKYKNISLKKFMDRSSNELYRSMNFSVKYAKENGYDLINFIQDDIQFLYRDDYFIDNVIDFFDSNKDVVQVNSNLTWKYKSHKLGDIGKRKSGKYHYGVLYKKSVCDNGITRVKVYDEIGEYPCESISWGLEPGRYVNKINGEIWFGNKCRKRGYYRALLYEANCGMMFDCAYVRGLKRYGKYFPPPNKYYFKMLDPDSVRRIRDRSGRLEYSYIEDFCIPDGWIPKTNDKHGSIDVCEDII